MLKRKETSDLFDSEDMAAAFTNVSASSDLAPLNARLSHPFL